VLANRLYVLLQNQNSSEQALRDSKRFHLFKYDSMAQKELHFPEPSNEVIFYEQTISSLINNTLIYDFFNLVKKVMSEGYKIKFIGLSDEPTEIENERHLRNYFKMHSVYRFEF
jgi:hypothetical protein